jgi:hypothetical protein
MAKHKLKSDKSDGAPSKKRKEEDVSDVSSETTTSSTIDSNKKRKLDNDEIQPPIYDNDALAVDFFAHPYFHEREESPLARKKRMKHKFRKKKSTLS